MTSGGVPTEKRGSRKDQVETITPKKQPRHREKTYISKSYYRLQEQQGAPIISQRLDHDALWYDLYRGW